MHLRRTIVVVSTVAALGGAFASLPLVALVESPPLRLVLTLMVAVACAGVVAWWITKKIHDGPLAVLRADRSYRPIERDDPEVVGLDWTQLDEAIAPLRTAAHVPLGEFTITPASPHIVAAISCFTNPATTIYLEVQLIEMRSPRSPRLSDVSGVHFSIISWVGGTIWVGVTDQLPRAESYLVRGPHGVLVHVPDASLAELLQEHSRLVAEVERDTGKRSAPGVTVARFLALQREKDAAVASRLARTSGFAMATELDTFAAEPSMTWATEPAVLAQLPERPLSDLDGPAS